MAQRTALILETNAVITERYLSYIQDSDWRILLKDSLNGFLEKLQQEKFDLVVAEEVLVPQGIVKMMQSTGIPFILSTSTKKEGIQNLPRNFNRTEMLTVFNRVAPVKAEPSLPEEKEEEHTTEITMLDPLAGLEDLEEEPFELTSDAVLLEPEPKKNEAGNIGNSFETPPADPDNEEEEILGSDIDLHTVSTGNLQEFERKNKENLFAPPPIDLSSGNSDIADLVASFSLDRTTDSAEPKKTVNDPDTTAPVITAAPADNKEKEAAEEQEETAEEKNEAADFLFGSESKETDDLLFGSENSETDDLLFGNSSADNNPGEFTLTPHFAPKQERPAPEPTPEPAEGPAPRPADVPEEEAAPAKGAEPSDSVIREEIRSWLDKNAKSIIKEIVLEQLADLSGKHND